MKTERANAKINLFLNVTSKRDDGYHNLQSVFHSVSLCDLVTLDYLPDPATSIRLEASGNPEMPTDCRNLAYRAAEKLLMASGRNGKVRIYLEKHIPMAAGLGGGSTDAATVLRLLNRALGEPLTMEGLCKLGATLGADVPFCIRGGSAYVGGIGDEMTEAPKLPPCFLVISCKGEGVSTPAAYRELDEMHGSFAQKNPFSEQFTQMQSAMEKQSLREICGCLYNVFEEVVPPKQPFVNEQKKILRDFGAIGTLMSGSGPSVFGIFENEKNASNACEAMKKYGADAFVCIPQS